MSTPILLAAGYALLLWAIGFGLRTRAGSTSQTWWAAERAGFERAIALVPLAVADAVLLGAALFTREPLSLIALAAIFVGVTRSGMREWAALRTSR